MSEETDSCVKFSRHSWHYRLLWFIFGKYYLQDVVSEAALDEKNKMYYKTVWKDKHISLCPYMRRVVYAILLLPGMAIWKKLPYSVTQFKDLIHIELIFATLCLFAHILINLNPDWVEAGAGWAWIIGFLGGNALGLLAFGVIMLGDRMRDRIRNRPKKYKDHKTTGLIKTYVKAKHHKICPCVEFVD